jgi:hypothetical protein
MPDDQILPHPLGNASLDLFNHSPLRRPDDDEVYPPAGGLVSRASDRKLAAPARKGTPRDEKTPGGTELELDFPIGPGKFLDER